MTTFAEDYDRYRPRPPAALLDLLCRLAGTEQPTLVVDLGSGTGLSARAWKGRAGRVVGVEPDEAMRAVAEALGGGVEYVRGDSGDTGLTEGSADLVTVSQALHWMEPEPTFAEAARILRPGGVFAAYDYDPVPVVHPEVDDAFYAVLRRVRKERERTGRWAPWTPGAPLAKDEHLARMRESGCFRFARQVVLHSIEEGDADRLLGLVRSYGGVEMHRDADLGLDLLEEVARRVLGDRVVPFFIGYRAEVGVR